MILTQFNKENLGLIRDKFKESVSVIEKEYGINFQIGTIRFAPDNFATKLKCFISSGGLPPKQESRYDSLDNLAIMLGLENILSNNDLNTKIKINGKSYIIIGAKMRSYKFPIIAKEEVGGKSFKFKVSSVVRALGRKLPTNFIEDYTGSKYDD